MPTNPKQLIKQAVRRALIAYRPIDERLRGVRAYRAVSSRAERIYRSSRLSAGRRALSPDRQRYFERYFDVAVDPHLVVCDSFWGRKVGGNPYAVFLEMYRRAEFDAFRFVWVKNEGVAAPAWMTSDPRIEFVTYRSRKYVDSLLAARYLVGNSNFPSYFIRKAEQDYINLWHGIPLKCMGADIDQPAKNVFNTQRNFTQSTHICLASEYAVDKTVRPYGDVGATKRATLVGSPRIDVQLRADVDEVRRQLGIDSGKRLLLYAPTWRGEIGAVEASMSTQLKAIETLHREFGEEYELLLSIHNYTRQQLRTLPSACKVVPDDVDINEVLAATDVLVSDYSSIFFDFLVLDRPVVLYTYDLAVYKRQRGLYLDLASLPVAVAHTPADLVDSVRAARVPSSFDNYRAAIDRFLPLEDGRAAERVVDRLVAGPILDGYSGTDKRRLLFHPGHLKRNGITTAFLNLLQAIDLDRYEIYVIVDVSALGSGSLHPDARRIIEQVGTLVLKSEATYLPAPEMAGYRAWTRGDSDSGPSATVERYMGLELRRLLSDTSFHASINYSGYSVWWTWFMSHVDARRTLAYQHNDLMAELQLAGRNQKQLRTVFPLYADYDRLVSVSPVLRDINTRKLDRYYPSPDAGLFARNLVDPDQLRRDAERVLSLPTDMKTYLAFEQSVLQAQLSSDRVIRFVTSGRLSPEKNQTRLIHAFKRVVDAGVPTVLFIMGEGPMKKDLQALINRLGLDGSVMLLGHVDNPMAVIAQCDCFVLSSDHEGQPMVLLEALAIGTPMIGTDIPAIAYVIGERGTLAPPTAGGLGAALLEFAEAVHDGALPTPEPFDFDTYLGEALDEFYRAID